jgi:hypothetical protein
VPLPPHSQPALDPTPMTTDQAALFACDDSALMAQYLAGYPPLQPNRVMAVQPPSNREEMVYPVAPAAGKYNSSPEETGSAAGLGIQSQPHAMNAPIGPNALQDPYSSEVGPNSFARHGGYVRAPPRYNSIQGFEVKDDPDSLDVQGRPSFDLFPHPRTLPARRGPFKDSGQRELTARTRKIGSCIRCRMQRIRVSDPNRTTSLAKTCAGWDPVETDILSQCNLDPEDERGPCISCKKIAANSRVYRLNCLRWKITDVKLFKPGQVKGHEWTNRWKDSVVDDIGTWESSDLRVIQVTEGYTNRSIHLQVRRFQPQDGDKLDRSWVSGGVKKSVTIPPFAIVDMESAKSAFDQHIKEGLWACCKQLLGPAKLLWQTYALAIKLMTHPSTNESERKLLISTLDLWMSVRLTTKSFEIVGNDTLDMPQNLIQDENNPLHGKIPLPPVMGAQIDSVLIHQIQPQLRRRTLEELQKMTQDKKQKTWLTTYLVTFILLHNIALITRHDADYARKHGMKVCCRVLSCQEAGSAVRKTEKKRGMLMNTPHRDGSRGRITSKNTTWVRESSNGGLMRPLPRVEPSLADGGAGANTLLAYFHYCNKGIYPFSGECKDQDLQSLAELDDEAMEFVKYTREYASEHSKHNRTRNTVAQR